MKRWISLVLMALTLLSVPFGAGAASYSDVPANAWYADAALWATEQELMNGISSTEFNPGGVVTRAQLVTILWRMEGQPSAAAAPFSDVRAGSWYADAVAWAYENHIVTGKTATRFAPGDPLSRAQAATILFRYAGEYHGYNTLKSAELSVFPDHSAVASYAQRALSWANAEGLITGSKEGNTVYLRPTGQTKRSQLATILQRFVTYTHIQGSLHQTVRTVDRFHYQLLDAEKQEYYRRMDAAVEHLESRFYLGEGKIPSETVALIYTCYIEDNPEHFYLDLPYSVEHTSDNKTYVTLYYTDGATRSGSTLSPELRASILAKKQRFDEAVHNIVHTIHVGMKQVEKEKAIHDWLITHNSYSLSAVNKWSGQSLPYLPDEFNAYGAIINGTGVCEAYSTAFQVLCHAVGIHCTSVEGVAEGQPHRWNAVRLDGEWYVVDVTFDDPIFLKPDGSSYDGPATGAPYDDVHYRYFNRTCQSLPQHKPHQPLYHPTSTGTKYSYENYFKK